MSLCILEMVLRDKVDNRSGNPFIHNKSHAFTSQTLAVKRILAGICRRLALYWDLVPEMVRCLMVLIEHYDVKIDNYESIVLDIIDRLLLKSADIQRYALILYENLMKSFEQQRERVRACYSSEWRMPCAAFESTSSKESTPKTGRPTTIIWNRNFE